MKKLSILLIAAILMFYNCNDKDSCKSTHTSEHSIEFYIAVHVSDVNTGAPVENYPVHVVLQKHYCDGDVDAGINDSGNTNSNGSFFSNKNKKSHFNKQDYVQISVYGGIGQDNKFEQHYQVMYDEIKEGSTFVKNFVFKI